MSSRELDQLGDAPERVERSLGSGVDGAAELGRAHPEASALEQAAPDAPLERLNPLGHGRLRQLQRIGGAVHAPGFDGRDKSRQLASGQRIGDGCPHGHIRNVPFHAPDGSINKFFLVSSVSCARYGGEELVERVPDVHEARVKAHAPERRGTGSADQLPCGAGTWPRASYSRASDANAEGLEFELARKPSSDAGLRLLAPSGRHRFLVRYPIATRVGDGCASLPNEKDQHLQVFLKRLMGLEPTTFCMAIV
jgi:hypothetical protein